MKARLLAVLLVSTLVLASAVSLALAQDKDANVQYVDCSQVQSAIGGQYGNAIADGRDSTAEVAQELNITQNQVNACLGNLGEEETTKKETTAKSEKTGEETTPGVRSGEETTVVDGETIIIPKNVASDELPETGGPTGGGYGLAAGCALLCMGLILNRIAR